MGSTRLPSKALKTICNKTIVEIIIERIQRIENLDEIILTTGPFNSNSELVKIAERNNIRYFCGSEENVLDRFLQAADKFDSDTIIRVTGDCPLIDYDLIAKALKIFNDNNFDVLSNVRKRTYPDGFDFEIFKKESLLKSWDNIRKEFKDSNQFLETFVNPTKDLLENPQFSNYDFLDTKDNSHIRLTLDYEKDFELISKIYEKIYPREKYFVYEDILNLLSEEPELYLINQPENFPRKSKQM